MKYLNSKYKLFESEINDIIKRCKKYNIEKYEIDDDGQLTVFGDVDLYNKSLDNIPLMFKEVHGDFDISNNNIKSLFGSPIIVGRSFKCSYTRISNLKHAPIEIGYSFLLYGNNDLIEISDFPKHVGGDVWLFHCNNLKSLYGCLKFLNCSIDLGWCHSLNTLKYGPDKVIGSYLCRFCKLKTLNGAPEYVGGIFDCSYNELSSLKFSPKHIGNNFYFHNNNLSTFYYFPYYMGGKIYCHNNPVYNVWKLFKNKEQVDYFNQMKIISGDGKKINIKRLNVFLNSIGKDSVESVYSYENI